MRRFAYPESVERWCVFEAAINGPSDGNPFLDYRIKGTFQSKNEAKTVEGFYDGNGIYKVRFMPSFEEEYKFAVEAIFTDEKYVGGFTVTGFGKQSRSRKSCQYISFCI